MTNSIRFCLCLHNHQPIGNFDHVFEQAYQDSYLPFLDVYERYAGIKLSLHTSGPLMEWLDERHPEYLDRLRTLVDEDRVEIIGGPFYEPILTMIPARDRIGQIREYSRWLEGRLGAEVQGMWMPERVWEQSLADDLAEAGMQFTVLDDTHFKNTGLKEDELFGYYLTEEDGRVLRIFPGSERLRYLIPFGQPQETVDYLGHIAANHPDSVVVFGDDGEKFGTWPDTKKHVYDDRWLVRFFDTLSANSDWINTCTLSEAVAEVPPLGKVYIPQGSYREMTEWAMPVEAQEEYDHLTHELQHDSRWPRIKRFLRGGFWRNFKVKYAETNEMYCRQMMVSRKLDEALQDGVTGPQIDSARRELYRGQCNCAYWHGAFGGVYLPHLRNAIYNHLIAADNLIDRARGDGKIQAVASDLNFDARPEVRLSNQKLVALLAPAAGGQLYELDVRTICHNVLATMTRRPEAYHRKVLEGPSSDSGHVASIHDRVVFKQEGLDQRLQYDQHPRKSLLDHFYDDEATLEAVWRNEAPERGDFLHGAYEAKLRRNPDRVQALLSRHGNAFGVPLSLTKGVTLDEASHELEFAYLIEGLPPDRTFHFAVELNFAGLPSGADDRYFYQGDGSRRGDLGTRLNLHEATDLGLIDEWLGIDVRLSIDQPSDLWTFPIETVSQSEGGFELVHQSVVVMPHWHIRGDSSGRWTAKLRLALDTSLAESRMQPQPNLAEVTA